MKRFPWRPGAAAKGAEPADALAQLLEAYMADLQMGMAPEKEKLLIAHPSLAETLKDCFAALEFIHGAAVKISAPAGAPAQLGDFKIIRVIGSGGMGVVYEAEQLSLKRRVALKVLRFGPASDAEAMKRFQREAETVANLHHTNIVPIHAIGSENGVHYYAMQFIEGESLAEAAGKPDRWTPPPSPSSASRPPRGSPTRTNARSSIATSSPPIYSSTRRAASGSPTSGWPSASTTPP